MEEAWKLFYKAKVFPRGASTADWLRIAFEAGWHAKEKQAASGDKE